MLPAVEAEPVPLVADRDGVLRVDGSRVTLDVVVDAFQSGATAEEIAQQYPSLALADVYAVISYYLRHEDDVAAYLRDRHAAAEQTRRENIARFDPAGIRDRLLARRR